MKKLIVFLVCSIVFMSGCSKPSFQPPNPAVRVVIEGESQFPEFLVGRWRTDNRNWEFVFEPDGTISYAIIDDGFIAVRPSVGIATKPMKKQGKAIYELGQWVVEYSPEKRYLAVEVVVEHVKIDIGDDYLEGKLTDIFSGPILEDCKTWEATWISSPEYVAFTPEPAPLPIDPNDTVTEIQFRKVTE